MATSDRKRQEKQVRKAAKRKQHVQALKRSEAEHGQLSARRAMALADSAPIHACLAPVGLFERGIGTVLISRRLPNGELAIASFLVDVWCLGVKNVFFAVGDPYDYQEHRERVEAHEALAEIDPACARQLVEGAEAYARDLGLSPHSDYAFVRQIFGDIDAAACPSRYQYGKDGKPFYVSGPYDSEAKSRRIVQTLHQRCGAGNYDYVVHVGAPPPGVEILDLGEIEEEADVIEGEVADAEDVTAAEAPAGEQGAKGGWLSRLLPFPGRSRSEDR